VFIQKQKENKSKCKISTAEQIRHHKRVANTKMRKRVMRKILQPALKVTFPTELMEVLSVY
jgi:hypothetical protein